MGKGEFGKAFTSTGVNIVKLAKYAELIFFIVPIHTNGYHKLSDADLMTFQLWYDTKKYIPKCIPGEEMAFKLQAEHLFDKAKKNVDEKTPESL